MWKPRICNCWVWALWQWFKYGGSIIVRKSKYGPFPHFMWSPDMMTIYDYNPIQPRNRIMPPTVFKGEVKSRGLCR